MSSVLTRSDLTRTNSGSIGGNSLRAAFPASAGAVVRNYISAASLLVLGFAFYAALFAFVPFYQERLSPIGFAGIEVVLIAYLLILPFFYATFPDDYPVKCRQFWRALAHLRSRWPTEEEAVALRAVAVKAFFMPLMIAWLVSGSASIGLAMLNPGSVGLYEMMLGVVILIDLFFFTVAYGIEHPKLHNEIRSVEPTLLGWVSALACYPPFQMMLVGVIGWHALEYPNSTDPTLQASAGMIMLALMSVYAWASVALGLKASNLTNRGTVSRGPYAYIRHPAYVCKNLFWWVSAIPLLAGCVQAGDWQLFGLAFFSLSAWSAIYTVRALTEERHLLADSEYVDYCERVKWRFLPRVF